MWTTRDRRIRVDLFHYSTVNVNRCLLCLPFPVVHDQLLCLTDVEVKVVVLAPHCQVPNLLPIGCLVNLIRPTNVMSSARLMMMLELCVATQLWVNREYRRGLSTHP